MGLAKAFLFTWIFSIGLGFAFQTDISYPVSLELIIFLLFITLALFFIDQRKNISLINRSLPIGSNKFSGERILLFLFLISLFVSAAYSDFKFPALKFLELPYTEYNEFGLPGLQGLVNACYLSLATITFYRFLKLKKRGIFVKLTYSLLILSYPLIMLSRQMVFSFVLQSFVIWWILTPFLTVYKILISSLLMVSAILLFGLTGDIRSGGDLITSFIGNEFDAKYSIFYWVYVYATSPLNNLSINLVSAVPNNSLVTFMSSLLPSPLRRALGYDEGFSGFANIILINENLNMSTFFASGYLSYGWIGMFALAGILLVSAFVAKANMQKSAYTFFIYVVIVQVVFFSSFTNLLFYLPVIFQCFIFWWLHVTYKSLGRRA